VLEGVDADAAQSLSDARSGLLTAYESRDISAMYDANSELDKVYADAVKSLDGAELGESMQNALDSYTTNYEGAQKMIEQNSYNSSVLEFMRSTFNKFPTSELASFTGVEPPVSFE